MFLSSGSICGFMRPIYPYSSAAMYLLRFITQRLLSKKKIRKGVIKSKSNKTPRTMQCHYNAVNFLENSHIRYPIAQPLGRAMGCLLWVHTWIYIRPLELQQCMQYLMHAISCHIGSYYDGTWLYIIISTFCGQSYAILIKSSMVNTPTITTLIN